MGQRTSAYDLMAHGKYYTPGWTVRRDLKSLWTPPRFCQFWEPFAGCGNLALAISQAWGQACLATDIEPDQRPLVPIANLDFFTAAAPSGTAPLVIISNPPYGYMGRLAERCLARALALTEASRGAVIFLLTHGFDAARGRRGLIGDHPAFAAKITTSQRIRWTNIKQKKDMGPSADHAWFIWEWQARRRTQWAMRQMQVAR